MPPVGSNRIGWVPPQAGERRRRYVVTVARFDGETEAECDRRVVELLGVEAHQSKVTCTVYEPRTGRFVPLDGSSPSEARRSSL